MISYFTHITEDSSDEKLPILVQYIGGSQSSEQKLTLTSYGISTKSHVPSTTILSSVSEKIKVRLLLGNRCSFILPILHIDRPAKPWQILIHL